MHRHARKSFSLALIVTATVASFATAAQPLKLAGLSGEVAVEIDDYGVPHIFAGSWPDASRALGYLHASDRLWEMDILRRQAAGDTAEVLGQAGLDNDILMRRLGIRRTTEALWKSGDLPQAMRAELEAYSAGVNARIAELGEKNLPATFAMLGYQPRPWTPVDSLVFSKYMGWDQSGTEDDLWFGTMVDKLGVAAVEELWPIDRPYEVPTVRVQATRPEGTSADEAGQASRGTGAPIREPEHLVPISGAAPAYAAAHAAMSRVGLLGRGLSFGSNNWAVDGTKTASGKPILCSDPHLGFRLPSFWYTCHLSVRGQNVAGVTFPGGPIVVIGHNDHIAWGVTNMQADAVDYFVETVDPADPLRYRHRGEWKTVERASEEIPVRGEAPHKLDIDSTVHGPIVHREGRTIALCWTGLKPTRDMVAFWNVSRAANLKQFLHALDDLVVPALNMCYADDAGNIAIHPCGALPLRMRGQGRAPLDGASGQDDWAGLIPRGRLPLSINPPDHFVASANGRPAPMDYPLYLGWMWDVNYRIRRINDLLSKADHLTVDTIGRIQTDHYDKAAERFVPLLLAALEQSAPADPLAARAAEELKRWNFVAGTDSIGTVIWLRWLQKYRQAVWDDEWTSRGIQQPGGSWGFSGVNHREPMLEVLEAMTREMPSAVWFDDRSTPAIETRDEIIRRSFAEAIASLAKDFGADPDHWRWGNINQLQIRSLTDVPQLARGGGPVVGTEFTVNPGSDIGTVGGGASWRMIVDLGRVGDSVGVYPGGQSEDPASPHYADQMPLWAQGKYLRINMLGDRAKLPATAKTRSLVFKP